MAGSITRINAKEHMIDSEKERAYELIEKNTNHGRKESKIQCSKPCSCFFGSLSNGVGDPLKVIYYLIVLRQ